MIDEFIEFIREREAIRIRKESGLLPPWTNDPILSQYSFCNVRRDDDRVTKWLRDIWYAPNKADPDLWFAAVVARNVNEPDTLVDLVYPNPWVPDIFLLKMSEKQARGERLYRSAYMVRVGKTSGLSKAYGLVTQMFNPMWANREELRPRWGDTLNDVHRRLMVQHGMGSFLSQQVVADLMYYAPLSDAPDFHTFCAQGPGSRQGLNVLLGRPLRQAFRAGEFEAETHKFQELINKRLGFDPPLHAQDTTNIFCEWAKYYKARYLGISPRRKYTR